MTTLAVQHSVSYAFFVVSCINLSTHYSIYLLLSLLPTIILCRVRCVSLGCVCACVFVLPDPAWL